MAPAGPRPSDASPDARHRSLGPRRAAPAAASPHRTSNEGPRGPADRPHVAASPLLDPPPDKPPAIPGAAPPGTVSSQRSGPLRAAPPVAHLATPATPPRLPVGPPAAAPASSPTASSDPSAPPIPEPLPAAGPVLTRAAREAEEIADGLRTLEELTCALLPLDPALAASRGREAQAFDLLAQRLRGLAACLRLCGDAFGRGGPPVPGLAAALPLGAQRAALLQGHAPAAAPPDVIELF